MIDLNRIKKTAEKDNINTALVFKEYVQLVILDYLFRRGLFSQLVFQGGTALRLAYQGVRYSEDLDFVLKQKDLDVFKKAGEHLQPLASHIKKIIPMITGAQLKAQKETSTFRRYCLIVEADFLNAKDKTNIEIANVPSYDHNTIMIRHPDMALAPALTVETADEILSDKILAFAARKYIKGRDIWDIYFITRVLNIPVSQAIMSMVKNKIKDYGLDESEFLRLLVEKTEWLKKDGVPVLHEEMDRFLPMAYRDAYQSQYPDICDFESRLFSQITERWQK